VVLRRRRRSTTSAPRGGPHGALAYHGLKAVVAFDDMIAWMRLHGPAPKAML